VYGARALALTIAMLCGAVSVPGSSRRVADDTLIASVVLLERAVNSIDQPRADYAQILRGVAAAWPAGGRNDVKADLETFLTRAPGAGADFKCSPEFVRYRARKELLRLKDVLLDSAPQPAHPEMCYATPFAIDMSRPPASVEIYGYDFDREEFQVLLMDDFGFADITSSVVQRSHYHLSVSFRPGGNGPQLSSKSQRLAVTLSHIIQHAVPVIQSDTLLCDSRVEDVKGRTVEYDPPAIDRARPFDGSSAEIIANATLDYASNGIDATLCLTAVDRGGAGGAISGCAAQMIYTSGAERVIEQMLGGLHDDVTYLRTAKTSSSMPGLKTGPVDRWTFPLKGPAAIRTRKTRVVSTAVGNCISPIAYLEAKAHGALSPETIKRLDPLLKRVPATVKALRPRFAPD